MRKALTTHSTQPDEHVDAVASSGSWSARPLHRILRLPDVIARTGLRRSAIYALQASGEFPDRIHLTGRAVGWLESDIEQWLEERVRASRTGTHGSCSSRQSADRERLRAVARAPANGVNRLASRVNSARKRVLRNSLLTPT